MSKIESIATKLIKASDAYYNEQPMITDEEYDALFDRLKSLSPKHPVLSRIGFSVSEGSKLKKVKHKIPMGSLNKVTSKEELEKWVTRRDLTNVTLLLQEKLDGISVELEYNKGQLVIASTRGDGETGEDITHNVRFMQNVSLSIDPDFSGSLRGEILLGISEFNKYFKDEGYANPRNTVSGLSRKKSTNPAITNLHIKYFDCVPYELSKAKFFDTEARMIEFIQNTLGLQTVNSYTVKLDNALKWYDYYMKKQRQNLNYDIDGLVIKCNDIEAQESLGVTDGRPKGQIALKFPSSTKATKLIDVVWTVGTTGRISPVAVLEPVEVAGVTIRRASLHTRSNIIDMGLFKGAEVIISRRGDVIPFLEKCVSECTDESSKQEILVKSNTCPSCGEETKEDGEYVLCTNPECPAKEKGNIEKWVKITEMMGVGDSFIEDVLSYGLVKDPADLYTLTMGDLLPLEGYLDTKAKNIIDMIQSKTELSLAKFCAALNIANVSESKFEALVIAGYDSLDKILSLTDLNTISKIEGLGSKTAKLIVEGIDRKRDIISKCIDNGVAIKTNKNGLLSGLSFCFTGPLAIKRGDAQNLVLAEGGTVKNGVVKNLSYLVKANPNSQSNKSKKAIKYGTKVIGEDEFLKMVDFSLDKLAEISKT